MKDSPKNIKWHPAFCSAAKVEMREDAEYLTLEAEHYLSKEPIRIDLLIIKDEALKSGIKNEIGHIMRKYNIIEYKSSKDELNIDDYYKTVGYACLYKGYGENVDIIPADELTVLEASVDANKQLYDQIRKCSGMGTLDEWLDEAEQKGISQDITQGELQGKEKNQRQVIFNMYRDNFTLQQIARVVDLSIDAVKQILNSDSKMKV